MVHLSYTPRHLIRAPFLRGGRNADVASRNERHLLSEIHRKPGLARAELISHLDLTQQSVHRLVETLAERGLLRIGDPVPPKGRGQPSPAVFLNPDYAYTLGISINTDKAGVCLMDFAGGHDTLTIDIEGLNREPALDRIEEAVAKLTTSSGRSEDKLFGVGFAIAGYHVTGTQYNAPLPLQDWSLIELGPMLSGRFKAPVWLENGANAAAICENLMGVGRHLSHFAYLSFNYGFGGGVVMNGKLLRGAHGNAGEFSGMFDNENNYKRPALELLIRRLNENGLSITSVDRLKREFQPDWPGVADWMDEVVPNYNRMMNAICAIIDPQAIVFGGEIPRKLAEMFIARTEWFNRPRYGIARVVAKPIISEIERDASAVGAAALPFTSEFFRGS
ncbi:ROK family transcriptional regulator [Pseudovibrio exalbescens]|uniref:ROK family transcriptional regulator n=1 Tax=Pseudovibrio exalbescens TaxID=197461 RepID=UPI001F2E12DA|nr:ROK family transcriptional regulator [Pseudovibrio exalbescens]